MLTLATIQNLLLTYRYAVIIPLAFLEGPIIALVVGFMISLGQFDLLPAFTIFVCSDFIRDSFYYGLGRFGNKKNLFTKYSNKGSILSRNVELMEKLWHHHPGKTMFFSKLAYGLSTPFLISAGLVNLPGKRFFRLAVLVAISQYTVFIGTGYLLGNSYEIAVKYIESTAILISILIIVGLAVFIGFTAYARKQIKEMEKEET